MPNVVRSPTGQRHRRDPRRHGAARRRQPRGALRRPAAADAGLSMFDPAPQARGKQFAPPRRADRAGAGGQIGEASREGEADPAGMQGGDPMALHENLIDGDWVGGEAAANVNPANLADIVAGTPAARRRTPARAVAAAKAAFPAWSRSGPLERHEVLKLARPRNPGAQGRARPPAQPARKARPWPKAVGETVRAAQDLRVLRR